MEHRITDDAVGQPLKIFVSEQSGFMITTAGRGQPGFVETEPFGVRSGMQAL